MDQTVADDPTASRAEPEDETAIFARLTARIAEGPSVPLPPNDSGYFLSRQERYWDLHLADLVNDALALGLARERGLAPLGELMRTAFNTTSLAFAGYLQLAGHVNNLVLSSWMPSSRKPAVKVQALAQLHARSLVLAEEILALTFFGYPSGAMALSRTLHEVRVTARFLQRFEAGLAERYLATHIVELWRRREDFAPRGAARRSKKWTATEAELQRRYDEVISRFGKSMKFENGWAWPRFAKLPGYEAKGPRRIAFVEIESQVRRPADRVLYRAGSRHVHADHLGSIKTLYAGEANVALLGPRTFDLERAATQALWDAQDVAHSLLWTCGRFSGEGAVYYWLEALDQLAYVVRGSVADAQELLDSVVREAPSDVEEHGDAYGGSPIG